MIYWKYKLLWIIYILKFQNKQHRPKQHRPKQQGDENFMSEIKLPNTFEDIYKSIISNDYTYNRVKSIQPNLYFTISLTK